MQVLGGGLMGGERGAVGWKMCKDRTYLNPLTGTNIKKNSKQSDLLLTIAEIPP